MTTRFCSSEPGSHGEIAPLARKPRIGISLYGDEGKVTMASPDMWVYTAPADVHDGDLPETAGVLRLPDGQAIELYEGDTIEVRRGHETVEGGIGRADSSKAFGLRYP